MDAVGCPTALVNRSGGRHDPCLLVAQLPLLEKVLRTVAVYLFLVLALRLAGKRELAQLNSFDLVVLLSNTVQNAITGPTTRCWGTCSARPCC
jgi:hypothetical protein